MAIPPWAVDALRRGVGGVLEKMPPDTIEQLKKRAGDLLAELPQTAARGVDSVIRGAKAGKESLQRWSRRHIALVTPVVNASGCLCHPAISGVPLSEEAIEVAIEAFQSGSLTSAAAQARLAKRLWRCTESSELGILIASTIDGACLAVANANRDRPLFFHRSQTQRLPSGAPIPDAFGAGFGDSAIRVREVGSSDRVDPADVRGIDENSIVVAVDNGGKDCVWFRSLFDAQSCPKNLTRIACLPVACWRTIDTLSTAGQAAPALLGVLNTLPSTADLVITPGDGVMGGPRCGLIVGDKKQLEAIANSKLWPSLVADLSVQSAMTVTLESITSGNLEDVPVQAMLRTAEGNLRSRAERLATRIAAEPMIQSCQITANPATLSPAGKWSLPSRQLKLAHRDLNAIEWAMKLACEVPAVIVGVEEEAIVVDLRWIQPSDDAALIATLVGHEAATGAEQAVEPGQ